MMACVSPVSTELQQTKNTLNNAYKAKFIKTCPKKNIATEAEAEEFLITDKENRLSDDFMDDDVSSETQLYDALSLSAAISP